MAKRNSIKTGIYQKEGNVYYLYLPLNGKQTTRSTGKTNRKDAMEWAREHYPNLIATSHKLTINKYFDIYREHLESNYAEKTKSIYNKAINLFTKINHRVYLKDISSQDLEDFRNELVKKYKKTSVDIYLRALKSSLSYAFSKKHINNNPGKSVKSFPQPEKEVLSFTEAQIKQLLELSPADYVPIIKFALLTGMRLGEIKNCKWSDIKGDILTIGKEFHTKSKKIRKLYISNQLREVLNGLDKNSDYLFHYKDASSISKVFTKILRKGNFDNKFHFHCLRHTFITNMLNAGVPIVKVKEIAGHSDIKTTMRYAHISSIDKEAMERVRV